MTRASLRFFLSFALAVMLCAPIFAQNPAPAGLRPSSKFDPTRDPAQDLKAAIAQAKATNRRILLDVGGEWCVWCKYFDDFFEKNGTLRQYRDEHFVVVRVNFSKENENKAFLSQYPKVPGYPHLFVLASDGSLLHSQSTRELEEGRGYNLQAVSKFLRTWAKERS